jgi:adenosylmethionine-8-amino-7-oxononanoate aminotransferase
MGELLSRTLANRIAALPTVVAVRRRGLSAWVQIRNRGDGEPLGKAVCAAAARRGVAVDCVGDVIVLIPELDIAETDLRRLVAVLASSIAEASLGRIAAAA